MSKQTTRPPTRRAPLGEATRRVNNSKQTQQNASPKHILPHHESLRQDGLLQIRNGPCSPLSRGELPPIGDFERTGSSNSNAANPLLSAISKDNAGTSSNRNSQISTVSTNASDGKRIKSLIGPWKLGKTLGKGATARVRLARHTYTGQEAAIKIVQKKNAQLSQAGSLANLDRAESSRPDSRDGMRRMPIGIEREVAIMKLIQHPNIMKLYDIWENRSEIYLVLEYVDKGELFEHISAKGALEEEEAIKYFRQILSAVGYCHAFNICHRDLKPENILLTKSLDIKIADFGMAALHQSPDHKLKTSCGSPHYAAPELIRGSTYRGDKVDIWSMGVILYATLAGRLPFDVEGHGKDWLPPLLSKIKKGAYEMAPEFSDDAANLIWRILQVNPRERINLQQIWKHPLIRKYDYLDNNAGGANILLPSIRSCGRPVLRRSDISKELSRNLRSLWHQLSEQELMEALLSEEPNDQKLFYSLLLKYRDAQLENYTPDVGYSNSDYHHVRPLTMTKTYSTRQFPQSKNKGHGRQISRFTVISNVTETEKSYDPFKASHPQHLDSVEAADGAKITIHCTRPSIDGKDVSSSETTTKIHNQSRASISNAANDRGRRLKLAAPRYTSRSSLASSTRSRQSLSYVRAPATYKRGVSFSHLRRESGGSHKLSQNQIPPVPERNTKHGEITDDGSSTIEASGETARYIRSRKCHPNNTQAGRVSLLWTEDVRQLSSSLAKDCDEAFNRSNVKPEADAPQGKPKSSQHQTQEIGQSSFVPPAALNLSAPSAKSYSADGRPLPPPPTRSDSVKNELLEAKKQAELRKTVGGDESLGYLDRMVSHIDRLIQPASPAHLYAERRTSSAPADPKRLAPNRPLPSIFEARREDESPRRTKDANAFIGSLDTNEAKNGRIGSAPEPRVLQKPDPSNWFSRPNNGAKDTIRIVQPSLSGSPVPIPAPLTIRKKSSLMTAPLSPLESTTKISYANRHRQAALDLKQPYNASLKQDAFSDLVPIDENQHDEEFGNDSNTGTVVKKKSNWFKRASKGEEDRDWRMSIGGVNNLPSQPSSSDTAQPSEIPLHILPRKKFSLGRLFRKRVSKPDVNFEEDEADEDGEDNSDSILNVQHLSQGLNRSNSDDPRSRQIEPQRSWLAKLFNVKPASKHICLVVSKRRARQEIATILREWKRYGIRDVQVDRERNIVFGKVAPKNFLDLNEVAFAAECMTVIEHGKRAHLSICRFTQESGAASSFQTVVETMETVLKCRGMLVNDERRQRMMVKTLRSG